MESHCLAYRGGGDIFGAHVGVAVHQLRHLPDVLIVQLFEVLIHLEGTERHRCREVGKWKHKERQRKHKAKAARKGSEVGSENTKVRQWLTRTAVFTVSPAAAAPPSAGPSSASIGTRPST